MFMGPLPGWSAVTAAIAALTQSLARPIVRGMLPYRQAQDAVAMAILNEQSIPDAAEALPIWLHVLRQNIHNAEVRRDMARGAIKNALRPLIPLRTPWRRLMAEAHDINGDADFPLSEDEVADVVKTEIYFALPVERRPSHGR
jgi:hypothetical protein